MAHLKTPNSSHTEGGQAGSGTDTSSHFYSKFNYNLAAQLRGENVTTQNLTSLTKKIRDFFFNSSFFDPILKCYDLVVHLRVTKVTLFLKQKHFFFMLLIYNY